MSKLITTHMVLEPYVTKYPIFSPATILDKLESDITPGQVDLFELSELLSALLEDLEDKPTQEDEWAA